jgi:hypothetical protein
MSLDWKKAIPLISQNPNPDKMKKFKALLALFTISIVLIGCNPDDDSTTINPNPVDFSKNFGASASRDFIGQVVDTGNRPIPSATVKIGSMTAQTDVNGVFIINGAGVYEKFAYITATKTGYNDGSRALVPTTGKNKVKIMLTEFAPTMTIASGTASEVSIYSGTKIKFDGAFQTESGTPYSGSVAVCMFHLTPSNPDVNELMPGMLYAQDALGQERLLETYGMLQVELRGSDGQKLQLATGHTAQITMRIDDGQLAAAPATIPLWHFDEVNGYWKQQGSAAKIGNSYVGNVSHFSWWNCDAMFPVVHLTTRVVDASGNPLSEMYVALVINGNNPRYGITDNNGVVSGMIPANQTLTLQISNNQCGNFYSTVIGPFAADTTLPDITIDNSVIFTTQIQGTLLQCNNNAVTNGYVMLTFANGTTDMAWVNNGFFSFGAAYCAASTAFQLEAVDYDNLQTSGSLSYQFASPVTSLGNISVCNAVDQFIWYQIDGGPVKNCLNGIHAGLTTPSNTPGVWVMASGENLNLPVQIYSINNVTLPGNYGINDFRMVVEGTIITSQNSSNFGFNLTTVGPVNGFIDMTFSGNYGNSTGQHTISGAVHVRRLE